MRPKNLFGILATAMLAAAGCATARPPEAATTTTTSASVPGPAEPTAAEPTSTDAHAVPATKDTPFVAAGDSTERAQANADAVVDAMHDDLLACYTKRAATYPQAHGYLMVDIVIAPDGHVLDVETTGGALLGDPTMRCITQRIRRGVFAEPMGGGTLRIRVPLSFRRVAPGEEP
jgi:hypothetical protein